MIRPLAERFWEKVDQRSPDECWPWMAAKVVEGYGRFGITHRNRAVPAHRVAYELAVGPIPDGLHLDHLCRRRDCVNPHHLEPVTPRENNRRGNGWSGIHARRTHCPRGHAYTLENIYWNRRKDGAPSRRCRVCQKAASHAYRQRKRVAA